MIEANGKYLAKAASGVLEAAPNGTPRAAVLYDLLGGEDHQPTGETQLFHGYLTPAAEERTMEALETSGVKTVDGSNQLDCSGAKPVALVVEMEDYNGKSYPKVKWVNAMGSAGRVAIGKDLDAGALLAIQQRMKARLGAAPAGDAKGDEIPF